MKKQIKLLLIATLLSFTTMAYAKVNAVVSILPQQTFLKAIGGDKVNISLMVKPGNSPHAYEPKPSQMKDISKADIYFTIGVEFEHSWIPKFSNQNKTMKIVNMSDGIKKLTIEKHSHHHNDEKQHEDENHEDEEGENKDPHIWTSTNNVKTIASNILKELIKIDSKNTPYYKTNYEKFLTHIEQTNTNIKNILKDIPHDSKFMVFHPAWGYFAKQYHLTQLAIEVEGKNPKPKAIAYLIEEAKEENVKAVFTAPEFSAKVATQISNEVGIKVIKVSPLNPKWSQNLENLARAIANK